MIKVGLKKEYDRDEGSDHRPDQQVADERHKPHCDDEAPKVSRRDPAVNRRVNKSSRCVERKKHIIQKQVRKKVPELWPKTSRRERRALGVLITSAREGPPDVLTGRSIHARLCREVPTDHEAHGQSSSGCGESRSADLCSTQESR